MVWAKGDLEDPLVTTYLLWAGTPSLNQVVQMPVQPGFEHFQVLSIHFCEQLVPLPHHPDSLEFLPNSNLSNSKLLSV